MKDAIIETKDLTFAYPADEGAGAGTGSEGRGPRSIERGSFVVVLGHNGSGKSTLAKTFNAILLPCGGQVFVDGHGHPGRGSSCWLSASTVGMVFQNPDNQIVATVVEEDVAFAPENLGVPSLRRSAGGWMRPWRRWACSEFVRHAPHHALRRAEAADGHRRRHRHASRSVIVLDEPTAMLDPRGPAGGAVHHPAAQPGKGHHRGADHPLHE